jgi:hypothetical protein
MGEIYEIKKTLVFEPLDAWEEPRLRTMMRHHKAFENEIDLEWEIR